MNSQILLLLPFFREIEWHLKKNSVGESNEVEEPNKKKKTATAPVRQKRFAQDTKSSKVKSKGSGGMTKNEPSKEITGGSRTKTNKTTFAEKNNDLDVRYPSRTLRIFLKEMRIAWENKEDRDQIPKILNDLEHIASKLDLDSSRSGSATGGGSRNDQLLGMEF